MKKNILTMLLILSMVFGIASCAEKPELDIDTAKKNLKGEDYEVEVEDDEDYLDIGVVEELEAYSDDGDDFIYIVKYESAKYAKINYKILKQRYDSEIEALELQIKQIEYALKEYDEDLDSDEIDEYEDEIKELKDQLEETQEEGAIGISGSVVWIGTSKAIEDSKG